MRAAALGALLLAAPAHGAELLYFQDFEQPAAYANEAVDVNKRSVNELYGGQPPGFLFAQKETVETLNITGTARGNGTAAFGTGYRDPAGWGGNFAIGMLSHVANDMLGLVFNVQGYRYLNITLDISSIDVSGWGGPFVPEGATPELALSLFAARSGAPAISSDTLLDRQTIRGTTSPRDTFDWTSHKISLDASEAEGGWVILQLDLLEGGYAAFDNLRIIASDDPGYFGNPLKRPKR